jgi:hypothetical protein
MDSESWRYGTGAARLKLLSVTQKKEEARMAMNLQRTAELRRMLPIAIASLIFGFCVPMLELFKIYDGQIHKVEAFIRLLPPELELGGWPVTVSQP